eukprot:10998641-Alexandrium_andersonii.AAC.1
MGGWPLPSTREGQLPRAAVAVAEPHVVKAAAPARCPRYRFLSVRVRGLPAPRPLTPFTPLAPPPPAPAPPPTRRQR